ncbi:TatD family hydrolase [uncultured Sphaerochaeta sp.]|uniref:TatD family hydrolase n=1 Tax=uncultured Sphaerochaeta sp. TaxID=886478 RepID=UPI002A0A4F52|nr:TatD family hydrolase [uncultured Sphaerochaeta sp.]
MFDAHRHFVAQEKTSDALYCTSSKKEWEVLDSLSSIAIGAAGALGNTPLSILEDLQAFLHSHPTIQIGEVGLDRRFADMASQEAFLSATLDLAFELDRSLTLHIVQADGLALTCIKAAGNRLPRLLWHGFTGSIETAREVSRKGCILSFGLSIGKTRIGKHLSALKDFPLAIETDYEGPGTLPYTQILENQYKNISSMLGIPVEQLIRKGYECRSILANNTTPR